MSISAKERREIPDSQMGVPGKDKYPLDSQKHIKSAAHLINHGHITNDEREALAKKILRRAKEEGMSTDGMTAVKQVAAQQEQVPPMSDGTSLGNAPPRLMAPYYDETSTDQGVITIHPDELFSRLHTMTPKDSLTFEKAKFIVEQIHKKVEADSKPPTGNQNCQLCTWCAEAQARGINVLPRPIYSPRDPALKIVGETIVMNPVKQKFVSQRNIIETVRGAVDSRWYVHVNWKDSTGGHEFLVVNIGDVAYIMDAQAGLLKEIDLMDSTHSYFRDINFANSYIVRLDTKEFNNKLFSEMNDPSKVLPWNPELDVPYMKEHGMLGDMSDKWTMRPATEADLEFVYFSELETVGENKNDPKVQKYIREDAKESLDHTQIIVAENSDIGVYQAYPTDYYGLREGKKDWWYLAHIYIKPEYRTLGIGSAIIKRDIAEHDKILLQVMKSNTRAKKLYESLGFVVTQENDHGGLIMRLDKTRPVQESFMDEYAKRVNDEGKPVPEKCKCGGKISITLKGEPIYTCESCGKYYGTVPCDIQEGAFQDLRNGVNPYSDDLVFHVSMDKHIDGQVWQPRVPDYLDPYNPEDTGFEDNTTPRICFSTSIEGALNGITVNLQRQSPDTFDKMYVYIPEKPWKEYKHKTNKQLVKDKLVYDANVTREVWIMEPVRMKLYGVIRVDQIANAKRKAVVPTSKGQKDTRNYFTYKWHWVVKPKVLKKATKFDYSPERVIDDLCIDVKKFKYGLIKDGRLMTGNVSDADYDKYWVFHSGETVDQAGGGNCYDMVEYEAGYLDAFGVAYKKYFMNFTDTKNTKTINTHTICVVPHNGKFIYIEQAFKRVVDEWGYERKKVFDKLTDIFEYVAEVSAEYDNQDLNYGVWDYTNAEIDYGTPIKNFQDWIMTKCKMIYDGEAKKSNLTKEGYRMDRFGNVFTEAKKEEMLSDDMEDITIGDLNLEEDDEDTDNKSSEKDETISIEDETIDDIEDDGFVEDENGYEDDKEDINVFPSGHFDRFKKDDLSENMEEIPEYLKDRMSDEDIEAYEQPDEKLDADNVDLGSFGKDTSDIQNDFDPKEVTILMKLMASEADAMNEYMDGAKETNVDVLRRLYADIANEERFHMEQLLFAKCELTGEKYEPKDPEVKSEYEELLKMGMDEETAMQTAVDKCHIRGSISIEDDGEEIADIQQDIETMESTIMMFSALYDSTQMILESGNASVSDVDHALDVFVESCLIQEAVYDAQAADSEKHPLSKSNKYGPIKLLSTAIRFIIRTLMTMLRKFVEFCKRLSNHTREIRRFIKQNGLPAIFDEKASFYFINLNFPQYSYIDSHLDSLLGLAIDTVQACAQQLGMQFNMPSRDMFPRDPKLNIKNNMVRGGELLTGVQLVKTPFIIPKGEEQQQRIASALFGFNEFYGDDGKTLNTLNTLRIKCDRWSKFMQYTEQFILETDKLVQVQNSVYHTNRKKYDSAVDVLESVVKTCKAWISAMQHDINQIIKLDQAAMIKATEEREQVSMTQNPQQAARNAAYENRARTPESTPSRFS